VMLVSPPRRITYSASLWSRCTATPDYFPSYPIRGASLCHRGGSMVLPRCSAALIASHQSHLINRTFGNETLTSLRSPPKDPT
jgi:hypothetical protein